MDDYQVKIETLTLAGEDYQVRSLLDSNQFHDPEGVALARGIPEANWPYFGLVWASGRMLADCMGEYPLDGRRVLEIGCGLALAGMVSHRRHADITVSDRHPLAESFLRENLALNDLPPLAYRDLDWSVPDGGLGRFDLILASDVMYEPQHPGQLQAFFERHLEPGGDVVVVDPGRRLHRQLSRGLERAGFDCTEERPEPGGRARILHYREG